MRTSEDETEKNCDRYSGGVVYIGHPIQSRPPIQPDRSAYNACDFVANSNPVSTGRRFAA